jgi:hypothetical protein
MYVNNKYVLLNRDLLDKVEIVRAPKCAEVRNDDGSIEILIPESDGKDKWWFSLSRLDSKSKLAKDLIIEYLWYIGKLYGDAFETKKEFMDLVNEYVFGKY